MNLYQAYMDAINNNDGYAIYKLLIDGVEYTIEYSVRNSVLTISINDVIITKIDINGDTIFANTNENDYKLFLK